MGRYLDLAAMHCHSLGVHFSTHSVGIHSGKLISNCESTLEAGMIAEILERTLSEIERWEKENPAIAKKLKPSLVSLKQHLDSVIAFTSCPTLSNLETNIDTFSCQKKPDMKNGN